MDAMNNTKQWKNQKDKSHKISQITKYLGQNDQVSIFGENPISNLQVGTIISH